uniref:Peroxisome assembly protein 26 n=1 Tax=Zonotrichia albicollis TaxID=44394 RepID=A0A8D2N3M1_ZONAL
LRRTTLLAAPPERNPSRASLSDTNLPCFCAKHLFGCLFLTSFAEVKCSLCVVGIQALAEMNRWREVLSWVLQYYHVPEHLPPKVLELCILLYSKVREPQVMLEVGGSWLGSQANRSLPEFGSLLELYLAQVLLPLGRFGAAEELVRGCPALDSERRLRLLGTIGDSRASWARRDEETRPGAEEQQDPAAETLLGVLSQKLLTMLTLLRRTLRSMSNHFYLLPYKKMLLATFLLYLVVVRLDPGMGLRFPIFKIPLWLWRRNELLLINLVCVNVSGRQKVWVTRNFMC